MRCITLALLCAVPFVVSDVSAVEELKACQSEEELRKVFRRLALELHPDRAHPSTDAAEAADIFAAVRSIYEVLLAAFENKDSGINGQSSGSTWENQWSQQCMNAARAVAAVGTSARGSLGFTLSQGIHGSTGPGPVMEKLNLTYAQIMRGATLPYPLHRLTPCSSCGGRGHEPVPGQDPCPACGGHGYRLAGRKMGAAGPSLEDHEHTQGRDSESPHHGVQYTCPSCCGSGTGMRPCPTCAGTGWTRLQVNGTLQIQGGLKEKDILDIRKVWSPDPSALGGEEPSSWLEWPRVHPSHLQVAYDTSWESTRGFLLLPPSLVRVSRMSLLQYCRRQSVHMTLPTGITHTLHLGATGNSSGGGGGRPLASLQALRVTGGGIPQETAPGIYVTGDALLVLRLSFPDRVGKVEAGMLRECFAADSLQIGLVRYTAHLLASLYASWVEHRDGCPVEPLGLSCTSPLDDPLRTALGRRSRARAYWHWHWPTTPAMASR